MKYDPRRPIHPENLYVPGWLDNLFLIGAGILLVTLAQVC